MYIDRISSCMHDMRPVFFVKRTSDSLNAGLPIKLVRKNFKENDSFSIKKIVGSTLELSAKVFFALDKHLFKNMG